MGLEISTNNNSNPVQLGGGNPAPATQPAGINNFANSPQQNTTVNNNTTSTTNQFAPTQNTPPANNSGGLNLVKGQKLNLSKTAPNLNEVRVGLGWDINNASSVAFDLDAQVILIGANGRARSQQDLIFYNNLTSSCGSVVHQGDNQTGAGTGDDEVVNVYLSKVPQDVQKIEFMATIHDAQQRGQNFGQVSNAYIRLVDNQTGQQLAKFDLSEDYSTFISIILGEIYRHNGEWKFNATGQGRTEDLEGLCRFFGVI